MILHVITRIYIFGEQEIVCPAVAVSVKMAAMSCCDTMPCLQLFARNEMAVNNTVAEVRGQICPPGCGELIMMDTAIMLTNPMIIL